MSKEEFIYVEKPIDKLKSNFNERKRKNLNGFIDFEDFYNWFVSQKKTCFYCGIDEYVVQRIVTKSILTSNRFPSNGILKQGRSRGMWLEVDRLNPKNNYSRENCVLCCYFCNNDKSDVFNGLEYKKFFENRNQYLRDLIK
jgi:5-methylcytosine-specific restriction endonuclease McrA